MTLEGQKFYPGEEATPQQVMRLAGEYRAAAALLWDARRRRAPLSLAPYRFVAIHAVELYLNAYLQAQGHAPKAVRGMQHNFAARSELAIRAGMKLGVRTRLHLQSLDREYVICRYGPEQLETMSQLTRLNATLDEIANKVEAAVSR